MKKFNIILKVLEIVLFISVIIGSGFRIYNELFLIRFNSFKQTIQEQRKLANEIEMTAVTDRILDENYQLEFLQYFHNKYTDILFPQDFDKIERIK